MFNSYTECFVWLWVFFFHNLSIFKINRTRVVTQYVLILKEQKYLSRLLNKCFHKLNFKVCLSKSRLVSSIQSSSLVKQELKVLGGAIRMLFHCTCAQKRKLDYLQTIEIDFQPPLRRRKRGFFVVFRQTDGQQHSNTAR